MYKLLCKTEQENVGISLWYKNGKNNDPSIIFATGRHGIANNISTPYILYNLHDNPKFLYDNNSNIISGFFSGVSVDKNLILFSGNYAKKIEHSRLYKISPTTNKCKLLYIFETENKFSARCGIIKDKTVIIGGTNGIILIYNFDSKYNLINNKIINISSVDNIIVGLYLNNSILSCGIRIRSFELNYIKNKNNIDICFPITNKFTKSAIIDLKNDITKYFTTNMQCTSIYHNENYIICIGSGQKKYYSQCFYIPIKKNFIFGKKINLAICDGRDCLIIDNNLFILCVTSKHIYIENFESNNRIYHYIDNINPPCRGCVLYKSNKIIISSILGETYVLNLDMIN